MKKKVLLATGCYFEQARGGAEHQLLLIGQDFGIRLQQIVLKSAQDERFHCNRVDSLQVSLLQGQDTRMWIVRL